MDRYKNLKAVDVKVLTPKVMVLLSKFASELRKESGTCLKLNTDHVFMDVYQSRKETENIKLKILYSKILKEMNKESTNECEKVEEDKKESKFNYNLFDIFKENEHSVLT